MNIRLRHLMTTLGLVMLLSATAEARPRIIEPINGGEGIASPVRPRASGQDALDSTVRLNGKLEYSRREGLTLNGRSIAVTPRTTTFPDVGKSGRLVDPSKLDGKEVTLFGRVYGGVVDASLMIFSPGPEALRVQKQPMPASQFRPSALAPEMFELTGEAPR